MLTPEEVEEIYYDKYRDVGVERWHQTGKPMVQRELRRECWLAVRDAVRADYDREIALKLLPTIEADAIA